MNAWVSLTSWSKNDQCAPGAYWSECDHGEKFGYHLLWSKSDQIALGAHWSENDQKDRMMTRQVLTQEGLLVHLLHALSDRDSAYLLWYLLAQRADETPLRSSRRAIHGDLGGVIGLTNVLTATNRLTDAGLITTRVYPRTFTEYRVNGHAVSGLLNRPLTTANFLPGILPREVPFVTRWNAGEQFCEVPDSAVDEGDSQPTAADQSDNLSPTENQHDQ
ncbi:MAG: hypothetical protein EKK47_20205 [Burkholderiales bacterium]|nr:MAG: hypothetical protein EKK47_20205 [Burkholderiales bacterium]